MLNHPHRKRPKNEADRNRIRRKRQRLPWYQMLTLILELAVQRFEVDPDRIRRVRHHPPWWQLLILIQELVAQRNQREYQIRSDHQIAIDRQRHQQFPK